MGFKHIDKMQSDTLSAYPLTISDSALDISSFMNMRPSDKLEVS